MESSQEKIEHFKREGYDPVYVWDAVPNEEDPNHSHEFGVRLFVLEGEISITIGTLRRVLRSKDEIEIPQGTIHSGRVGISGCKYIVAEKHGK